MKITEQIKKSKIQVSAANGELLDVCGTVTIPITLLKEAIDIQHLEYCWKRMFGEEDEEENTNHIRPWIKRRKIEEIIERTDNSNVQKQDENKFLVTFLVTLNLDTKGILGLDTMRKMGAVIDMKHNLLVIGNILYD